MPNVRAVQLTHSLVVVIQTRYGALCRIWLKSKLPEYELFFIYQGL